MLVYFCLFLLVYSGIYALWKLLLWIFITVISLLQIVSFNIIKCFVQCFLIWFQRCLLLVLWLLVFFWWGSQSFPGVPLPIPLLLTIQNHFVLNISLVYKRKLDFALWSLWFLYILCTFYVFLKLLCCLFLFLIIALLMIRESEDHFLWEQDR